MSITIRPGQVTDNSTIQVLYQEAIQAQPLLALREVPQVSPDQSESDPTRILVALKDDQIIGYIAARPFSPRQAYRYTYQVQMVMAEEDWTFEDCQALYQAMEDHLIAQGLRTLLVTLTSQQISQIHFFQQMDYRIAGQLPQVNPTNHQVEMVWLAKSLS